MIDNSRPTRFRDVAQFGVKPSNASGLTSGYAHHVPATLSRRGLFTITTSAALVVACSSPKPGEVAKDGSVTIKHIFGETKIAAPPKRVVSAGFTEQDDLLAIGVVPIAITDWFGGQPYGVWPWAQPSLGSAQPVVLTLNDGIQVDQIAALKPDLIVAINAGLDLDTYTKLTAIAPTIAQSGPDAFFEPWKDQATVIGQAAFKADDMVKLVAAVDEKFAAVGKNNPQYAGKKALLLGGTFVEEGIRITAPGWRTDFLTAMGFTIPDVGAGLVKRDEMASVLDKADVLIWTTESDDDQAALLSDPMVAKLRATVGNHNVFTGKELAGAIAFASTLSYSVVADQLPPMLTKALA